MTNEHNPRLTTLPDGRRFQLRGGDHYRHAYEYTLWDVTEPAAPPVAAGKIYGARYTTSPTTWEWRWSRTYTGPAYTDLADLLTALVPTRQGTGAAA